MHLLDTDILSNTLFLALQKRSALLINIKHLVQITIETLTKLSTANSAIVVSQIVKKLCLLYDKNIVPDFQVNRANLRSYNNVSIENFHSCVAIPLLKNLFTEIKGSEIKSDTSNYPITDAFKILNPKTLAINLNLNYGMEDID